MRKNVTKGRCWVEKNLFGGQWSGREHVFHGNHRGNSCRRARSPCGWGVAAIHGDIKLNMGIMCFCHEIFNLNLFPLPLGFKQKLLGALKRHWILWNLTFFLVTSRGLWWWLNKCFFDMCFFYTHIPGVFNNWADIWDLLWISPLAPWKCELPKWAVILHDITFWWPHWWEGLRSISPEYHGNSWCIPERS